MAQATSPSTELVLPTTRIASARRSAPMFGHRPVGWGRHAGAVFGAAFVGSTVQTMVAMAAGMTVMWMTGANRGPHFFAGVAIGGLIMWLTMFVLVLAQLALFFTVVRALFTLARRNFGAAYLASGLVLGMLEASIVGSLKGEMSPRNFLFAAATGVLSGFVYWLIACRDREVVADEKLSETLGTFR
jgi:hypothetical protein